MRSGGGANYARSARGGRSTYRQFCQKPAIDTTATSGGGGGGGMYAKTSESCPKECSMARSGGASHMRRNTDAS